MAGWRTPETTEKCLPGGTERSFTKIKVEVKVLPAGLSAARRSGGLLTTAGNHQHG